MPLSFCLLPTPLLSAWFPHLHGSRCLISILYFQPTHSLSSQGNRKFSRFLAHSENIAFGPISGTEHSVLEMLLFLCFLEVIDSESSLHSQPSFLPLPTLLSRLIIMPPSRTWEFHFVFHTKCERRVNETRPHIIMSRGKRSRIEEEGVEVQEG